MLSDSLVRQSKYVIIDASHGGSDSGLMSGDIKEKDLTLDISEYIYDKLKNAGINVSLVRDNDTTITDSDRTNKILNTYGDNSNVILISNHVDSDEDNAQVVYALRNNNSLSNLIADKLESVGITVKEPYQRRLESNTALDYYSIHRNTGDIQTVLVNYGNTGDYSDIASNYRRYANAVADAIISYLGGVAPSTGNDYIVKAGDTLYSIARKFNTTVDNIKKINGLSSNFLTVGQRLIINSDNSNNNDKNLYVVKSGDTLYGIANRYGASVDDIKRLNNLSSNLLNIGQVLKIPTASSSNDYSSYTVKSGDTLYSIASRYNVSVDDIKTLNNLTSNTLSIGQVLKIPNSVTSDDNYITYTVKKGDNLYSIASRYGVSVADIMKLNNLSSNLLSIGQVLKIPGVNNEVIYTVKSGDNLYSIARQYGVSVDEIKNKNNLSSNLLSIGQKLII